jgi:hypothetical protein
MSLSNRAALSIVSFLAWLGSVVFVATPQMIKAQPLAPSASAGPDSVCRPLLEQLRWHEPFFGLRDWREVAEETLSYASPACRQALRNEQAPEVVSSLQALLLRADDSQKPLRRYVFRVVCQLRAPSLTSLILTGTSEPGAYLDCVDAVFAMGLPDEDSQELRTRYIQGLQKEPLSTPIPPAALSHPYVEQLASVVVAYDQAKKPRRDALYEALCMHHIPQSQEAQKVCLLAPQREANWALQALISGNISDGVSYLSSMPGHELPLLLPLLSQFDREHRRGRDRMHRILCQKRVLAAPQLLPACQALADEAEPRWLHAQKTKELNDARVNYHKVAVWIGKFMGMLALLIILHAVLWNRRRAIPDPVVQL